MKSPLSIYAHLLANTAVQVISISLLQQRLVVLFLFFSFLIFTNLFLFSFRYTTLSYRAPEMVNLYNNKIITTKADVWVSEENCDYHNRGAEVAHRAVTHTVYIILYKYLVKLNTIASVDVKHDQAIDYGILCGTNTYYLWLLYVLLQNPSLT